MVEGQNQYDLGHDDRLQIQELQSVMSFKTLHSAL